MPATAATKDDPPAAARHGAFEDLEISARGLRAPVPARIWSPSGAAATRGTRAPLPLLVVHDGPAYDDEARLSASCARWIAEGAVPAHRIALLSAPEREEWYSASARYAGALHDDVLPALAAAAPAAARPVAMGASLGALALLHADRRRPGAFAGLLLQSGSFFLPRFDRHESSFRRYGRIVRFVRGVLRDGRLAGTAPAVLTCGVDEENLANNRALARALDVPLHEVPGGHDYGSWRAALERHLPALLSAAWTGDRARGPLCQSSR